MTQKIRWQTCQSWCVVNRKHQQKHLYLLFQEVPYLQCLQVAMRGTELIGNEYFTYNGENKDSKND